MRILVADDEEVSRMVLVSILENMGHEVVQANGGKEAWEIFQKEFPRVVVSDWMMPEIDGLELCRNIRSSRGTDYTYVILQSGVRCTRENYLDAMGHGVDDFLPKPVNQEELLVRLQVAERIITMTHRVESLEGLLPICMHCKNIRTAENTYEKVESYISKRSKLEFSHGICPECMKKHYSDLKRKGKG